LSKEAGVLPQLAMSLPGLRVRVVVGAMIFFVLACIDLLRRGRKARRWREYLFLVVCVGAGMLYGVVNDQVTIAVSWEYFYYGKELWRELGPATPPSRAGLSWGAAKVGLTAGWSVGLLLGAVLLIANNPRRNRCGREVPTLPFMRLFALTVIPAFMAAMMSVILGLAGYLGWLNWMDSDFGEMWRGDV
jgi:hypothetical protein